MSNNDVPMFLQEKIEETIQDSHVCQIWTKFLKLFNEKLWHHLTLAICRVISDDKDAFDAHEIYTKLVSNIEDKINVLALANIACKASKKLDELEAIEFLMTTKKKVSDDLNARILLLSEIGLKYISLNKPDLAKSCVIDNSEVKDITGSHLWVQAYFYKTTSLYYRMIGNHTVYYNHSMRYIGCIDVNDLSEIEKLKTAYTTTLAVILSRDIYNFGELIANPIINSIRDHSENVWIYNLLCLFNNGDVDAFYSLEYKWSQQPDLNSEREFMIEKLSQMALLELSLHHSITCDPITFEEIAKFCKVDIVKVDEIIMKAMFNGLVRGKIDDIDSSVDITWTQPRVLKKDQMDITKERLATWIKDIDDILDTSSNYFDVVKNRLTA